VPNARNALAHRDAPRARLQRLDHLLAPALQRQHFPSRARRSHREVQEVGAAHVEAPRSRFCEGERRRKV
jgi:hypothetical protein